MRLYVGKVFLVSGWLKLSRWDSTLALFENEYHVPVLSPHVAAVMATLGELGFSTLLIAGSAAAPLRSAFCGERGRGRFLSRAQPRGTEGSHPVGRAAAGGGDLRPRKDLGRSVARRTVAAFRRGRRAGSTPSSPHRRATVAFSARELVLQRRHVVLERGDLGGGERIGAAGGRVVPELCGDVGGRRAGEELRPSRLARAGKPGELDGQRTRRRRASSCRKPSTAEMSAKRCSRSQLIRSSPAVCGPRSIKHGE